VLQDDHVLAFNPPVKIREKSGDLSEWILIARRPVAIASDIHALRKTSLTLEQLWEITSVLDENNSLFIRDHNHRN
jgi:hypothetical protein